jgi:hypothetical protein
MAYTTEFVDAGCGVLHTGGGLVTGDEVIDASTCVLQATRDGMQLRYAVADFTDTVAFSVNTDEIKAIARINIAVAEINRDLCVAVIAPSDHAFGMARMWQAHAGPTEWETCVFRDADEARRWLAGYLDSGKVGDVR